MAGPQPGWYDDPAGIPGTHRWWNGTGWTAATRQVEQEARPAPPLPSSIPQERRSVPQVAPPPLQVPPEPSGTPGPQQSGPAYAPQLSGPPAPGPYAQQSEDHPPAQAAQWPAVPPAAPAAPRREPHRRGLWVALGAAGLVVVVLLAAGGLYLRERGSADPSTGPTTSGKRYSDAASELSFSQPPGWRSMSLPDPAPVGFTGATSYLVTSPYACANGDQCFRAFVVSGAKTTGTGDLGLDFFANEYGELMAEVSGAGGEAKVSSQSAAATRVDGRDAYTQLWKIPADTAGDPTDLGLIVVWRDRTDQQKIYFFWECWDQDPKAPSDAAMARLVDSIRLSS